jgi:hypothetical protein
MWSKNNPLLLGQKKIFMGVSKKPSAPEGEDPSIPSGYERQQRQESVDKSDLEKDLQQSVDQSDLEGQGRGSQGVKVTGLGRGRGRKARFAVPLGDDQVGLGPVDSALRIHSTPGRWSGFDTPGRRSVFDTPGPHQSFGIGMEMGARLEQAGGGRGRGRGKRRVCMKAQVDKNEVWL